MNLFLYPALISFLKYRDNITLLILDIRFDLLYFNEILFCKNLKYLTSTI